MAKRFTASEKWLDPWFSGLSNLDKLAWFYILDTCNHAGIWQANWRLLSFMLGQDYHFDAKTFAGRIIELGPEKLFIPKFVEFQYGTLNPESKTHASVVSILIKEGVWKGYAKGIYTLTKPLPKGIDTLKDKDKDKAKAKAKDTDTAKAVVGMPGGFSFEAVWSRYPRKLGRKDAERHFKASVKTPQDFLDIQNALDHFIRQMRKEGRDEDKIPYGSSWFNSWRDWVNYGGVQMPKPPPPPPRPPEPPAPDLTEDDLKEMHDLRVKALGGCRLPGCRFCKQEPKEVAACAENQTSVTPSPQ